MAYSPQSQYPYPYPPPPPRHDNGRGIALGIATVVVLAISGVVYLGYQAAAKESLVRQQAQRIAATYAQAAQLYQSGRFVEAAPLFRKVRENTASNLDMVMKAAAGESYCYRMLGQQAQEANNLELAEEFFQQAVRVTPEDPAPQAELEAVQKARAILRGNRTSSAPGTPSRTGGTNLMPGFDPEQEPSEEARKLKDAQERLDRGNVLFGQGNLSGACREWHDAFLTAPNSAPGSAAAALRRQHCPPLI